MNNLTVAVIMGGTSFERDFSLKSGRNVCRALEEAGFEVIPLDADANLVTTLQSEKPDVAFICMHGQGGEDGTVASLLEFLGIPYVGSTPAACRASWSKPDIPFVMTRSYREGDSVASWPQEVVLPARAFKDYGAAFALDEVESKINAGYPLAVKPARGGSAMGVSKVESQDDLGEAIMGALAFDDTVLIQEWVDGVELSVAVVGDESGADVLPPVEIVAEGLYDTEARLDPEKVSHFCPARLQSLAQSEDKADMVMQEIERAALEVFYAYGLRDLARIDMIWDGACPRVLDVKTCPGMTDESLVLMACKAAGISLKDLCADLVGYAYERGC